jgi:hypothetical protein
MTIYYVEKKSGGNFMSYVYASFDRFIRNNQQDIKRLYAFTTEELGSRDLVSLIGDEKIANEMLAYYDWIVYNNDGIQEEHCDYVSCL